MSIWQLEFTSKRIAEVLEQIATFQRQAKMDRKKWVEEINAETQGPWKYEESSFCPAMLGRAENLISTVKWVLDHNWVELVEKVKEISKKADDYDEILGDLDDDDLRKLKVLMTRGDRYDREKLQRVISDSLGVVDDMEYEEAARVVDAVFTEDEESGGVRWTRGDAEEVTLNSKRQEFTYVNGSDVKVLKYHEVPAFFADQVDKVLASAI